MRAVVSLQAGPPESLVVQELPLPQPGPLQVRVRVLAAAVNFPDVLMVAGGYQVPVPRPFVPGSELAGEVTALGSQVTGLSRRDRVVATMMAGAFAEEVVLDSAAVTLLPRHIDPILAAGFLVAYRTAFHALDTAATAGGDVVLVLGAAGGVGLAAVDLGKHLGATVVAAASSAEKLAACTRADVRIDYGSGDLRAALRDIGGVDVVIDPVGGTLSEPALRALRPGGRFVTVGYASGDIPAIPLNLVLLKQISIVGFDLRAFDEAHPVAAASAQADLLTLLADGSLSPVVNRTFPLADAAVALRHVADRRAIGKVILVP